MFDLYTTDEHGLVCNGEDTYRCAALDMRYRHQVVLNWTDQRGTALNIHLAYGPTRVGTLAGMIDGGPNKMWVGVAGHGCWAFEVQPGHLHADYIAEKLKVRGATAIAVAELLDNIRRELAVEVAR